MKKIILFSLSALVLTVAFVSRGKQKAADSPAKQALLAHTWQMETVAEYNSANNHINYQRGAVINNDDLSSIRLTCKSNGTIQYVDEHGESGNNATYQLLDNDRKIRISYGGLSITGENLVVDGNQFAYTLKYNTSDSSRFVFSPI
jgi:hypothetical protein